MIACTESKTIILVTNAFSTMTFDINLGGIGSEWFFRRFERTELAIQMATETDQSIALQRFGGLHISIYLYPARRQKRQWRYLHRMYLLVYYRAYRDLSKRIINNTSKTFSLSAAYTTRKRTRKTTQSLYRALWKLQCRDAHSSLLTASFGGPHIYNVSIAYAQTRQARLWALFLTRNTNTSQENSQKCSQLAFKKRLFLLSFFFFFFFYYLRFLSVAY